MMALILQALVHMLNFMHMSCAFNVIAIFVHVKLSTRIGACRSKDLC